MGVPRPVRGYDVRDRQHWFRGLLRRRHLMLLTPPGLTSHWSGVPQESRSRATYSSRWMQRGRGPLGAQVLTRHLDPADVRAPAAASRGRPPSQGRGRVRIRVAIGAQCHVRDLRLAEKRRSAIS
jgi:hypothetical protein